MTLPLCAFIVGIDSIGCEKPTGKLIGCDFSALGQEVGDMQWLAINYRAAPALLYTDFVHERFERS
ncbi:hypothetical protein [Sphingomonas sanguinis]|uniref:Uncharacterized protein n=1 Tax=Sphingomonas sanguinis TaxID=33051 RepID=A0A147IV71_9SPHN|nr:hypothetical protein [Sphingomonas sanguinis]KTT99287.1 hypothetical protein SB4_09455 [Sphingomonas sanguinis]